MNFIGDEGADRVRAAYPDPVWRRLTEPSVLPIDWSPIDARLAWARSHEVRVHELAD